jgi:hypothetical protein
MEKTKATSVLMSIHAVELQNFSAESLFSSKLLDEKEMTIVGIERRLDFDEDGEGSISLVNKRQKAMKPLRIRDKKERRKNIKDKKANERWDTHGHLPRQSVIQKYVGNSQAWKTTRKPEDLRAKAGGYCAMPCDLKDMKEIYSVQEAVDFGFTVIKCNGVYVIL